MDSIRPSNRCRNASRLPLGGVMTAAHHGWKDYSCLYGWELRVSVRKKRDARACLIAEPVDSTAERGTGQHARRRGAYWASSSGTSWVRRTTCTARRPNS